MEMGEIARPLAGGDDGEARSPRPFDVFADDGGLIAIGEAVDHPLLAGAGGKQRACHHIRLHTHHDDVPARLDRGEAVLGRCLGLSRRLDHDVETGGGDEGVRILGQHGAAALQRGLEGGGGEALLGPAGAAEARRRPGAVEIGHAKNVHPRRGERLGEIHGGEFARPDQSDADRFSGGGALGELRSEIDHVRFLPFPASLRGFAAQGGGYMVAPSGQGANSASPKSKRSLLVRSPEATRRMCSKMRAPHASTLSSPSRMVPQLMSMSSSMRR